MNRSLFPVDAYRPLKNYFDMLHKQDNHSIALKQAATNSISRRLQYATEFETVKFG